jgi:hypothetical protein
MEKLETTRKSIDLFEDWNKKIRPEVCSPHIGLNKLPVAAMCTIKQTIWSCEPLRSKIDRRVPPKFSIPFSQAYLSKGNPRRRTRAVLTIHRGRRTNYIKSFTRCRYPLGGQPVQRFQKKHLLNRSYYDDDVEEERVELCSST